MPSYNLPLALLTALALVGCGPRPVAQAPAEPTALDTGRYLAAGLDATNAAQAALLQAVTAQMQAGGVARAIPYCNTAAGPLADSLRAATGLAVLRRTSARWRNPANEPTPEEAEILAQFQAQHQPGGPPPAPVVVAQGNQVHFYRPIVLQMEACLKCHGDALAPEAQSLLQRLYPADRATGYALGQLRGAWHVAWNR